MPNSASCAQLRITTFKLRSNVKAPAEVPQHAGCHITSNRVRQRP